MDALDVLLERSKTSGVLEPGEAEGPEFREFSVGRMACEAPFRFGGPGRSLVGDD